MNVMINEQTDTGVVYIIKKIEFRLTIRFRTQASSRRPATRMIDGRMRSLFEWTATRRSPTPAAADKQVSQLEIAQNKNNKHEKVD